MYGLSDFYCMWDDLSSSGSFQAVEKDILFDQEQLFARQLCNCGHPETLAQLIFLRTI